MTEAAPPSFEAAELSPQYRQLMEHTPDTSSHVTGSIVALVFFAGFAVASGVMTYSFRADVPEVVVPALVTLLGAWIFVRSLLGLGKFKSSPLERVLAVVKDETVETTVTAHWEGKRRREQVTRQHSVLLETRDGKRESHDCSAELARLIVRGDVGVAYLKGGVLLDFKPITTAR